MGVKNLWASKVSRPKNAKIVHHLALITWALQGPCTFTVSPLIMDFFESGRSTITKRTLHIHSAFF